MKAILFLLLVVGLTACGKNAFKKTEYNINGEWLACSQTATYACGKTLVCGDTVYTCMTNVEMR